MAELETLTKRRQTTKANVTRIKNIISPAMSPAELECRLSLVEAYFKQLLTIQNSIEEINAKDTARADIEDLCIKTKSKIIELLGDNYKRHNLDTSIAVPVATHSKLPSLDLPKFDGKYSTYKNFISSFKQFVHNDSSLSNIEKFNHLLHCLSGQALDTIRAFQITAENYEKALKRLEERYDNKTLIFMEHIQNLYELPNMNRSSGMQLRSLVDCASAIYSSLRSLGSSDDICNALIIYIINEKTDNDSQVKWREKLDYAELPSWDDFCKFLERRCQFLEASQNMPSMLESKSAPQKRHIQRQQNYRSFHTQEKSCSLCKCLDHWLTGCSKFQAMSIENRFVTAKKLGLCINCLSGGHVVSKCKSKHKCKHCNKSHHTMLHRTTAATQNYNLPPSVMQPPPSDSSSAAVVNVHLGKSFDGVILATAVVLVRNGDGGYTLCRALLDSCSQVNLITENFATLLNLPKIKTSVSITGVGSTSTKIKFETNTIIRSRLNSKEYPMNFYITNRVSGYQPDVDLDIKNWNLPTNIDLADEQFNESQPIDMLIGADAFFEILGTHKLKLGNGLPTLQDTSLGYVVSGSYRTSNTILQGQSYATVLDTFDDKLNKQLEVLWSMEEITSHKTKYNAEHQACEIDFIKNIEIVNDGRLQVKLPFKNDPLTLGLSYNTALRRFKFLEKRLSCDANIRKQYSLFMKEYEELGHMTKVQINSEKPHYYLPHHYVLKPSSVSTKLRVVFDASSKTSSMKSLNDILCVGPTIQDEIFLLLIRFRLWKYALTADITKMYRMVLMHPTHRPFQQILWRYEEDQPIATYQLNTVTYGMSSSPYLAIRSLHFLAEKYQHIYEIGSKIIKTQFYVDDLLTGANDVDMLCKIKEETTLLLKQGGFELTKFKSNNPLLQSDDNQAKQMKLNDQDITSALGIMWNPVTDNFLFSFQPKNQYAVITKRAILSLISSIFDPIGLIYPLIIQPRVLLQDLWIAKVNWDTEVNQKVKDSFAKFVDDLKNLHLLKVPRYILPNQGTIQLHGFCDASLRAYGCCLYARTANNNGDVSVHLIASKCRIAPTKKRTMPQLELCAAHILSKLYSKIMPVFKAFNPETFLWSDSTVVLLWLKKHSSSLVTFVGNRISDIQEETSNCMWRHVPTSSNPADILSRAGSLSDLTSSIWYTGPSFLKETPNNWPRTLLPLQNDIVDSAMRKSVFKCQATKNIVLTFIDRTSSYSKILRVICWLFRMRYKNRSDKLNTYELQRALHCVIWIIQQNSFSEELNLLSKNHQPKSSLKSLGLFIQNVDGFSLIRVGGRLQHANIPENRKHPFLLPKNSHFVNVLVRNIHIKNYHAGPKALLAFVRQNFWIVGCRDILRKTVRSCVSCIRYRPKLLQQVMGGLPAERITPARPFERCGVDFCGPIFTYLKIRGKQPYKCYIAIFICFVTKAVHIEAVSDLSADAFIAALKRLIGRRGLPSNIYCDNATNFIGANAQLLDLKKMFTDESFKNSIHKFCSENFINFNFIPPRAPHFGGIWEAAVKSAKGHLYRTLAGAKMTYEELSTTLIEIEAIMNSRPITCQSSDPNDLEALTPGHFLIGCPLNSLPEPNIECHDISNLQRWKRIVAAKQKFWKGWSTDYLNELIQKSRWSDSKPNIEINTLVLIHEDNTPPMKWVLGRITKIYPGKDGRVRVVDVKTNKGLFRRPVHKLAILLKS